MADGMWVMKDDGSFELQEPYKSMLTEARTLATAAWANAMLQYLSDNSPYTVDELSCELYRRCDEEGLSAVEIVNEFVLEALSGDL